MQDWSDSFLDYTITDALRQQTIVTPQHKRLAWERLREQAELQLMLPPVPVVELVESQRRQRVSQRVRASIVWLGALLLDESCYDRALRERRAKAAYPVFEGPLRTAMASMTA
jgi:hypothetical protein